MINNYEDYNIKYKYYGFWNTVQLFNSSSNLIMRDEGGGGALRMKQLEAF